MKEREIEDLLLRNTAALGYPDTVAMRNVVLVPKFGSVDVILLPEDGLHRLVLIEAKTSESNDALDKVIGQLLKYYAFALTLGTYGLDRFRTYATDHSDHAVSVKKKTPQTMFGRGKKGYEMGEVLTQGRQLQPNEVAMFIALNGPLRPALKQIITTLSHYHNLRIGAIQVDHQSVRVLVGADVSVRLPDYQGSVVDTDPNAP